jgi:hypothetical protein
VGPHAGGAAGATSSRIGDLVGDPPRQFVAETKRSPSRLGFPGEYREVAGPPAGQQQYVNAMRQGQKTRRQTRTGPPPWDPQRNTKYRPPRGGGERRQGGWLAVGAGGGGREEEGVGVGVGVLLTRAQAALRCLGRLAARAAGTGGGLAAPQAGPGPGAGRPRRAMRAGANQGPPRAPAGGGLGRQAVRLPRQIASWDAAC